MHFKIICALSNEIEEMFLRVDDDTITHVVDASRVEGNSVVALSQIEVEGMAFSRIVVTSIFYPN